VSLPYIDSSWSSVVWSESEMPASDSLTRRSATSNTIDSARSSVSATSSGVSYPISAMSPATPISRRRRASSLTMRA
jgi:hypothetical protein